MCCFYHLTGRWISPGILVVSPSQDLVRAGRSREGNGGVQMTMVRPAQESHYPPQAQRLLLPPRWRVSSSRSRCGARWQGRWRGTRAPRTRGFEIHCNAEGLPFAEAGTRDAVGDNGESATATAVVRLSSKPTASRLSRFSCYR
ncbi:hypothetical protein ACP4OV_015758 [Aristida adscensionis]